MTNTDLEYIKYLLSKDGCISGPVLELGGGYGGATCKELLVRAGNSYASTDMMYADGVDFTANFETGERFFRLWSRLIHKIFNTYGRGMSQSSHVAIGVVMQKPE